jgi:hypothetical protein
VTVGEWIIAALVAIGGGGGIAGVIKVARPGQKRTGRSSDRPSDAEGLRPRIGPTRSPSLSEIPVTHTEMANAIGELRDELRAEIEATEGHCDRGREELARRQDEHYRALTESMKSTDGKVERALGILDGQDRRPRR